MGLRIKVRHDLDRLAKALESTTPVEALTRQVEEDMRPYVKRDTGQLADSAREMSEFERGRITYSADRGHGEYAAYAYYDEAVGDHYGQNPRATARWAEKAKADCGEEWAEMLGKSYAKEMGA
ncbi:minor capsid protein [uncultured Parolsenella sp.]|uniref:minor capsid protein n=1 Tax=uncultured Parolsenella sp. TaxID=2083008 RepID=UPI0027D9BDB2|nr:minor capsid protein [uncultured Parolsenella sp.]